MQLSEYIYNEINMFHSDEFDNVYDLKCHLIDRFYYFLDKMNASDLLSFITDLKFNLNSEKRNRKQITPIMCNFINDNNNELNVSLSIVNNYLLRFKTLKINKDDWTDFCYKYTSV